MHLTFKVGIWAVTACLSLAACNEHSPKQPVAVSAADPVPAAPPQRQEPAYHPVDRKANELDLQWVSLPPDEVMAALMRFNPWKGKFESDAAFAKRMSEIEGRPGFAKNPPHPCATH